MYTFRKGEGLSDVRLRFYLLISFINLKQKHILSCVKKTDDEHISTNEAQTKGSTKTIP
jgi:hypothetical protein